MKKKIISLLTLLSLLLCFSMLAVGRAEASHSEEEKEVIHRWYFSSIEAL